MMRRAALLFLLCAVLFTVLPALAQAPASPDADNPASAALRQFYNGAKRNILGGAEKMPEESYSFRPVAEVRNFGELVAHIAGGNYLFCSGVKGEPSPVDAAELEKTHTTKAQLLPALQASFEYCDPLFASLTDSQLGDKVQFFGGEITKSRPFTLTVAHSWEHYGNMVTYLRLKGIVPPSSEPRPPPAAQEKPAEPPKRPDEPAPAKKEVAPPKPAEAKQPPPAPPKSPASRGDAAKGQSVYARACAKCHGADGTGVAAIGKALKVELKPLGGAEVQKKSDGQLKTDLTDGTGKMQKVAGLSADDVANVIAYLRTLGKK
jgi:mono/diheme cytochrome c family protein